MNPLCIVALKHGYYQLHAAIKNLKLYNIKPLINYQFSGAPLSIQQSMEFFCAVVILPSFGITPEPTALRILDLALKIAV